jgi:g-D-glutamyl-meso-diaminopimelate peptidase
MVLGKSVDGRNIMAYTFGNGPENLVLIAGVHGGYSWNTTLLANDLMKYLQNNIKSIPSNVKITVIPLVNPDGLSKVVASTTSFVAADVNNSNSTQIAARYNSNKVDLNRNFDCDWKKSGKWQTTTVSGGTKAFSEPESQAVQKYINENDVTAAIVWYSAAGGVYSSSCGGSVTSETAELNKTFATAAGYKSYASFDSYETSGDLVNWLAKSKIPAISVLLTNHQDTDYDMNLKGLSAVLDRLSN